MEPEPDVIPHVVEPISPEDWEQREVYAKFGLAIYFCQCLETLMTEGGQRRIVVTGAGRGIGAAIAQAFVGGGDEVVALDLSVPRERLPGVRYVEADVSDPASVAQAFVAIDAVDVLVNNAGIARTGLLGVQPAQEFIDVISTNLVGAYLCAAHAVPRMSEGSSLISIASTAALVGLPGRGAYSAAKAGLLGLTRAWAVELAPRHIRAKCRLPGLDPHAARGAGARRRLVEARMDDAPGTGQAPRGGGGDRARRALARQRRLGLHHRSGDRRRRRLDRPRHRRERWRPRERDAARPPRRGVDRSTTWMPETR